MLTKLLILMVMILPAQATELKVLSWNAFMLPKPIKNSNQGVRTRAIAEQLKGEDFDFIFLQEAFMSSFRRHVGGVLRSEYPHQYYLGNPKIIYPVFGSGVFLLGKHPFKVVDKVYFKKCASADCFAAKGAVLVESTLPEGKTVQFIVTHLQAKESKGALRTAQLNQVKDMLARNKRRGITQFLIGDLNIDSTEPEFETGQETMGMKATDLTGPIDHTNVIECYRKPSSEKEWIDHMWVSQDAPLRDSTLRVREYDYTHKGKTCPSSDHYAIEGHFLF